MLLLRSSHLKLIPARAFGIFPLILFDPRMRYAPLLYGSFNWLNNPSGILPEKLLLAREMRLR